MRIRGESKSVHLQDLRHSYASTVIKTGGSLMVVKELLGDADIRTTQRYAHVEADVLAATRIECRFMTGLDGGGPMEVAEFAGFIAGYRRKTQEAAARRLANLRRAAQALDRDRRWAEALKKANTHPSGNEGSLGDSEEMLALRFGLTWTRVHEIVKQRRKIPSSALWTPKKNTSFLKRANPYF